MQQRILFVFFLFGAFLFRHNVELCAKFEANESLMDEMKRNESKPQHSTAKQINAEDDEDDDEKKECFLSKFPI